ncbi:hypothetical protein ISN76_09060 [Dyella halodurans]|uniref:Uncharacterized protein n=1 Tax=Dyella halodurans TaxID=1920171 RepID=A0ABV9C1U2_9GAMM|nr:hypothetical protein [Dyella halodurans]
MNTHDHHDDESLPGEDELQALYRSLPRKEPSPALDQAVRQAADDAVRSKTHRRFTRWPVAAASAAVLVLALGLGLRMREPSPSLQAPAPAAATIPGQPPAESPTPALATSAPLLQPSTSPAPMVAQAPPAEIPRATRRLHESAKSLAKSRVATTEMADQAFAPPPPAPAPPMAIAQAPMASAVPPATAGYRAEPAARAMTMRTMAAAAPVPAAPAPASAVDATASNPNDTPAQELDKIRLLFAQHRRDEALQRLSAFRQAHPDVSLPDDVRAQLPDHE